MSTFDDVDMSVNLSVQDIESAIAESGGILGSWGYGFDCPTFPMRDRTEDWKLILVDRRGMGNHGSLIAVAQTQQSYDIQRAATMSLLRCWADEAEAESLDPNPVDCWGEPDEGKRERGEEFKARGDFACVVIPLLWSPFASQTGHFLFSDEKWSYFYHRHGNYLRVGDDRSRLWVRRSKT